MTSTIGPDIEHDTNISRGAGYRRHFELLLVLMLVCLSGNMVFIAPDRLEFVLSGASLVLLILLIAKDKLRVRKDFILVFGGFLCVFVSQTVVFSFLPIITITGFIAKLFVAYAVARQVEYFPRTYVIAIVAVSILSLLFYIPDQLASWLGVDFRSFFLPLRDFFNVPIVGVNERINIGVYNFQVGNNASRNAAFFWEPGAFAGYLLIALIMFSICKDSFSPGGKLLVLMTLVLALLSTQSTMGIAVLPFALVLFLSINRRTKRQVYQSLVKIILGVIALGFTLIALFQFDFMYEKIVRLFLRAINKDAGWHLSRFGSMLFDWEYIKSHPLIGWGQSNATQYSLNPEIDSFALGNGMTGIVRQLGLLGASLIFIPIFRSFRKMTESNLRSTYIVFLLLLILFGEYFHMYPLFLTLMFIGVPRTPRSSLVRGNSLITANLSRQELFGK